jgi:hypothetical protein
MKIDLIFLAFNRIEYTRAVMEAMIANTEWDLVRCACLYDDGSTDGTRTYLESVKLPVETKLLYARFGGPVAIMGHYMLSGSPAEVYAKIDNDTMLPPNWLSESLPVMDKHPELDLLGIEAFNPVKAGPAERSFLPASHIGGIGLMRRSCFRTLPKPNGECGRFGFTRWQKENRSVIKGWINPSLPVFLLDKCAFEPWNSLGKKYIAAGWQRPWPFYTEEDKALWEWTGWR